jgi:hypothetical protein
VQSRAHGAAPGSPRDRTARQLSAEFAAAPGAGGADGLERHGDLDDAGCEDLQQLWERLQLAEADADEVPVPAHQIGHSWVVLRVHNWTLGPPLAAPSCAACAARGPTCHGLCLVLSCTNAQALLGTITGMSIPVHGCQARAKRPAPRAKLGHAVSCFLQEEAMVPGGELATGAPQGDGRDGHAGRHLALQGSANVDAARIREAREVK